MCVKFGDSSRSFYHICIMYPLPQIKIQNSLIKVFPPATLCSVLSPQHP